MLRSSLSRVASRAAARPSALVQVRGLAGPTKVQITELTDVIAPAEVERSEPLLEMGVLYPPGKASPMESVLNDPPIVVDGVMVKTGGGPTGHPIEYIRLSAWCAHSRCFPPYPSLSAGCSEDLIVPRPPTRRLGRDPTPVACKYSGMQFVSKQALDYAASVKPPPGVAPAEGVWPLGGPNELKAAHGDKNFTYGEKELANRGYGGPDVRKPK